MSIGSTAGQLVRSRDGNSNGVATGATHRCRLEGCTGRRITVRWGDGRITHPCSKAMLFDRNEWRIA